MSSTRRNVWSWALYDWANSAFATTVMAGFFPVFFKEYWNTGVSVTESTFRLGLVSSLGSLVIVIMAPVLGAIADNLGKRKGMLLAFAFLGILMTAGLYLVEMGEWRLAAVIYVLALVGFSGANIFYDSLLPFVSSRDDMDRTSALGFSLGYLGGGLLLALNVLMTLHPDTFGLEDTAAAIRVSFVMVAAWWLVFSLPLIFNVPEPDNHPGAIPASMLKVGFSRVFKTLHEVRQLRNVWLFLVAYWLYIDGVDTVVRMAVDYGLSLGFDQKNLILALLITQFTGFPAALLFGQLGSYFGPRPGIFIALLIYMLVTIRGALMNDVSEFYFLAFAIGIAQGGIQALSRSLYARMIPKERAAEFFGFYNMLGKFAAILGPVMMGWVAALTGSPRAGILSLLVLFLAGALVLVFVRDESTRQAMPK
ncbi:MAG: MFS transporter [Gammaproteobacteria bacterium]|nr:MAG: MFS transporter [Gammaproteobacteria bacterium]